MQDMLRQIQALVLASLPEESLPRPQPNAVGVLCV